jgi:hypothetical protein
MRNKDGTVKVEKEQLLNTNLEIWKKTIDVQQHFNTIELQIRSLAITVLTAILGAAALLSSQNIVNPLADKLKDNIKELLASLGILLSPSELLVLAGLLAWVAFYFMDRWWYHKFLHGAVTHAMYIEKEFDKKYGKGILLGLSSEIGNASPININNIEIHSNNKIDLFYGAIAAILILIIIFVY